ncbi:TPA: cation transporter [Legionella pneumophila]|uniref:cation diffusion facilitator family transporter n=1 Tax=Legionella pneumophila TaxID=446 RepID=UPI000789062C|nr:cation diffusion facilitator family transporter [Legionella pneumophila]MDW8877658.1 cation diffusion facilitator family transporter [Legionella pneumophila subsp. fraseri]MDW8960697.1 cation diffusion facilitator family transporter [Legionella pneumophila subsp. fraseri]MDW9035280.1 cation diffusion facilitator family transporter [Legionella pneumophila subsp. fraseri]MDW9038341.1 cation diffusion facilitator family transporter [Legionella pneumophila subsp. fraseri]MDW9041402.1 cation dif
MYPHDRYWQAKKVTLIGAFINALLGIVKMIGGFLYHSHALIADGVHSISDLITDVMVVFASKYGSVSADDSHPYGHQRIETAATLLLSLLLILAGCGIAWDALDELLKSDHTMPNWLSIPIVGFSIIANEALFHYTRHVGKQISSQLIIANAWHHRSDAASSIVVLIGLIGSLAGLVYLDAIAAVIVSLMIIKMGWSYGWNSVKELVDTAVDAELFSQIERVIQSIDGVKRIHQLRSRFMGSDVLIDVHILVSPKISVSEGHYIAQHVHHTLVKKIDCVRDVIVHVDPEDDEISCPSLHLPSRAILQEKFFNDICYDFPQILFWNIHYLNGKMSLDIFCSNDFNQWKKLHNRAISTLKSQIDIEEVRLFGLHEVMHYSSN